MKLPYFIGVGFVLLAVIWVTVVRLSFPDQSETRLAITCWPAILLAVLGVGWMLLPRVLGRVVLGTDSRHPADLVRALMARTEFCGVVVFQSNGEAWRWEAKGCDAQQVLSQTLMGSMGGIKMPDGATISMGTPAPEPPAPETLPSRNGTRPKRKRRKAAR